MEFSRSPQPNKGVYKNDLLHEKTAYIWEISVSYKTNLKENNAVIYKKFECLNNIVILAVRDIENFKNKD